MNTSQIRIANALYTAGNNAGNGYAPNSESVDDAAEALVGEGWTLEHTAAHSSDVSVLSSSDEWIAIGGDSCGNGAWAVDITEGMVQS